MEMVKILLDKHAVIPRKLWKSTITFHLSPSSVMVRLSSNSNKSFRTVFTVEYLGFITIFSFCADYDRCLYTLAVSYGFIIGVDKQRWWLRFRWLFTVLGFLGFFLFLLWFVFGVIDGLNVALVVVYLDCMFTVVTGTHACW